MTGKTKKYIINANEIIGSDKMYDEELNEIINKASNVVVIKVYNKLIRTEQLKGGIIISKKYIAEELNLSEQSVRNAIRLLKDDGYITETKFQGQTQFILNHLTKEKPAESVEKVEKPQPKQEVIRKGGKTVTRMMVEGF